MDLGSARYQTCAHRDSESPLEGQWPTDLAGPPARSGNGPRVQSFAVAGGKPPRQKWHFVEPKRASASQISPRQTMHVVPVAAEYAWTVVVVAPSPVREPFARGAAFCSISLPPSFACLTSLGHGPLGAPSRNFMLRREARFRN
jgi:hypothetical protein